MSFKPSFLAAHLLLVTPSFIWIWFHHISDKGNNCIYQKLVLLTKRYLTMQALLRFWRSHILLTMHFNASKWSCQVVPIMPKWNDFVQVAGEKVGGGDSHVTGKKKMASSNSSCLPHLLLTQRMFISTYGGVNGALLSVFKIYFGLSFFRI